MHACSNTMPPTGLVYIAVWLLAYDWRPVIAHRIQQQKPLQKQGLFFRCSIQFWAPPSLPLRPKRYSLPSRMRCRLERCI